MSLAKKLYEQPPFSTFSNPLNVLDAIYTRRSIRNFDSNPVEKNKIQLLLDSSVQAPSAMNLQPWCFLVIQSPELLHRISEESKKHLSSDPTWNDLAKISEVSWDDPRFDIFYGSTTLIVICSKTDDVSAIADCYLAAENLMIAATGIGLGTCPIGLARDVLQSDEIRKELDLPPSCIPVFPIALGYPSPSGNPPKTEKSTPQIIKWV